MAETGHPQRHIRIVLADDHILLRQGLQVLIDAEPDLEIVGQASSGTAAADQAGTLSPDIIVMDVSMPHGDGIRATANIRNRYPAVRVLGLSRHLDPGYARRLLDAGASGYVVKRTTVTALIGAIRLVGQGETFIDAAVAPLLAKQPRDTRRGAMDSTDLTPREGEVLRLIARGRSNRDIAVALGISVKTVEFHKARCVAKLGLSSRADIVRYAITEGWMEE